MAVMVYWFGAPWDWLMTYLVLLCKDKVASPALERSELVLSEAHNHLDKVKSFPAGLSRAPRAHPKLGPAAGGHGAGGAAPSGAAGQHARALRSSPWVSV